MAVVRVVLTPHPEFVRARPVSAVQASEDAFREPAWFETAYGLLATTFGIRIWGQLANVLIALLTPAAMLALVMGLWRVAADLGWAGAFLLTGGFFSHWQVWIAFSAGLKMLSSALLAWGPHSGKFSEEN